MAPTLVPAGGLQVDTPAAKAEGKVVGYGVLIDSQWEALTRLAQDKIGIQVENFRAPTARVISRVETEKSANQNLVDFVTIESIHMDAWATAGFIDKLPTELMQRVPDKWRDPNGYWVVFTLFPTTVIYNTQLVKDADAPRSLEDLLDPKWKGKIAMTDPTLNETFLRWFYVIRQRMGEEKAKAFFDGLGGQNPTMFESGLTVSTHVLSVGGPNGHLAFVPQNPMPAGNAALALASKTPPPQATRALADLFLSRDFLQASGDLGYQISVPGVKSAIPGADEQNYELLPELSKETFDDMAAYLKTALRK